ncbi:MAG: hypothetical protein E7463_08000 [Ruminococcaceae bacterium]|nr:hypothetical protein [Oscillospiraceae bacterium]
MMVFGTKRQFFCFLMSLVMLVSLILPTRAAQSSFSDVPANHWALSDIETMVDLGVVNGMGNGTFAPESPVSAAHFATMLAKLCFSDQFYLTHSSAPYWWANAMQTAQYNGLLENIPVGSSYAVRPDGSEYWNPTLAEAPMTRYEMAQVIANLLEALDISMPSGDDLYAARTSIADYLSIPFSYREAVTTAYALECLAGMDSIGTFNGASGMTRAQACRVMSNIIRALEKQSTSDPSADFSVSVSQPTLMLKLGETVQLYALVSGLSDYSVSWSSDHPELVSVSADGTVTANAPGTAVVTLHIASGDLRCEDACIVTVPDFAVTLDHLRVTMNVGDRITLHKQITGLDSLVYSASWTSTNPAVICADPAAGGSFIALSAGEAELVCTVYSGGMVRTAACQVTILMPSDTPAAPDTPSNPDTPSMPDTPDIPSTPEPTPPSAEEILASYRAEVLRLVNEARAAEGKPALRLDDKACSAAQVRAAELITSFSHTRPDGRKCFTALDEAGATSAPAAENIAAGYASPEAVVNGWLNSDGHRKNIMNGTYTAIGIGYVTGSSGSKYGSYWVQMFIG